VLHREHRGGGPAGGVDLGVDVFHVIAGRLGRDHQSFGYLLVGQAAGEQDQDLDLAGGQACQRFPAPRHPVPGRLEHGVHGRAIPIATGVKLANPDLKVLVVGGDGDAFAIGGGHFIHGMRRNVDVTYVIMDNEIYGLTKGQTSPTSMVGFVTKTTPNGTPDRPVNPLQLAMASGATFVARAFSGKPKELADLIVQGIDHKGFAIIDTYSPCPTFNKVNTFKYYRDQAQELPSDHNPSDVMQAWARAQSTDPVYLGVLYRAEGEASFEDHIVSAQSGSEANAPEVIDSILERYS